MLRSITLAALLASFPSPSLSQAPTLAPAPSPSHDVAAVRGTRVILLGSSGGPVANASRGQPAILLVIDGRPYLIDSGEGTLMQLKKAGFDPYQVSQIFLTHLHMDHTAGLAPVLGFNWVSGKRRPVAVYGPPGTMSFVGKAIDYLSIPARIHGLELPPHPTMSSMVTAHDLPVTGEKLIFQDDKVRVTAVANSHYATMNMVGRDYGADTSLSYRFETADRTVVITGDTGPSQAVERLARGADILFSEVLNIDATVSLLKRQYPVTDAQMGPLVRHMMEEHLSPEEVGKLGSKAGVGMIVLYHVAPASDVPINPLEYLRGVRVFYSNPVVYGRDLEEF